MEIMPKKEEPVKVVPVEPAPVSSEKFALYMNQLTQLQTRIPQLINNLEKLTVEYNSEARIIGETIMTLRIVQDIMKAK